MKVVNPFAYNWQYVNDPNGFIAPYELYGEFEEEVLKHKYNKLHNRSYGKIKRFVEHV